MSHHLLFVKLLNFLGQEYGHQSQNSETKIGTERIF